MFEIFSLFDLGFYIYFIWFITAAFFSWFIPGFIMLGWAHQLYGIKASTRRNNQIKIVDTLLLALPLGIAMWGLQGYVFGYLGLRMLSYLYLVLFNLLFVWIWLRDAVFFEYFRSTYKIFSTGVNGKTKSLIIGLLLIIFVSSIIQIFGHIGSGFLDDHGASFYFVNSVDGVMHLSYIQELVHRFPPHEPGAVEMPLVNYHYWSDLVQADLIRIWNLPVSHMFFQFTPVLISIVTTLIVLRVINLGLHILSQSGYAISRMQKWQAYAVGIFLLTFGADAAYLFTLVLHGHWGFDVSALDTGVSFYFNIPQVYARLVFLSSIPLLFHWFQVRSYSLLFLITILVSSLFGFKVYYGIYVVLGICTVLGFEYVRDLYKMLMKRQFYVTHTLVQRTIFILVLAMFSLAIYLPVNVGAGGLRYSFFEWPRLLLSADNIDFNQWFLRMQVYEAAGNTRMIFIMQSIALLITCVSVYGIRMLGFFPLFANKSYVIPSNAQAFRFFAFFVPVNMLFFLLGLLTLQTSGGLNVFNFLIVPIFSFILFTALLFARIPSRFFIPLFIILIIFSLPRSAIQLNHYWKHYQSEKPDHRITHDELAIGNYIRETYGNYSQRTQPIVVQVSPKNQYNHLTPYVAYALDTPTYLGGVEMLKSHNQPTDERLAELTTAFYDTSMSSIEKITYLRDLGITHVIVTKDEFDTPNYWPVKAEFKTESVVLVKL